MNDWLIWLAGLSLVTLVASALSLPWIVAVLPEDYFFEPRPARPPRPFPLGILLFALRNLLGAILFLAGVAMLFLPGQGLLTIILGVMLMDVPGKRRFELALAYRPKIWKALQWLRAKAGAKAFSGGPVLSEEESADESRK